MRTCMGMLLGALSATAVVCASCAPAQMAAPKAAATAASATTAAPAATQPALTALLPTATPTPPAVEGPLAAAGQPLTGLLILPGSPVRYGLLTSGLVRSEDGCLSWQQVSDLPLPLPLASPRGTLYAGGVPSCYKDETPPPFRRSADGGSQWDELPAGRGIRPVAAVPGGEGQPDTLYGISCAGLNVSADGGETWQSSGPTQGWDITGILPIRDGQLRFLAVLTSEGGSSHLAWFDERGKLEQDLAQGLNFWGSGVPAQAGSALYLADSTGVWRQNAAGGRWELSTAGLEDVVLKANPLNEGVSQEDAARGFGLLALAADPLNPRRLALGTVRGLYVSVDGGERWRPAGGTSLAGARISQVLWDGASPGTLYVTTPGAVYRVRLGSDA